MLCAAGGYMYLPSESATQKSSYLGKRGFCLIPTVETLCPECKVLSSVVQWK